MNTQDQQEVEGYTFYKIGGGKCALNVGFMLGFVRALAEYPDSRYKTIKQAFERYFSKEWTNEFVKMAIEFKRVQDDWVRWPSLPIA